MKNTPVGVIAPPVAKFDYVPLDRESRAALKRLADEGRQVLKQTLQGVWRLGQIASKAKDQLPHGSFGNWVEAEWGITHHTANNYMRVFSSFQNVNDLQFESSPTVFYLLSAPSVDEETRAAVVEQIKTGEVRTVADTKAAIARGPMVNTVEPVRQTAVDSTPQPPPRTTQSPAPERELLPDWDEDEAPAPPEPQATARPGNTPEPQAPAQIENTDQTDDDEWLATVPIWPTLAAKPHGGKDARVVMLGYRYGVKHALAYLALPKPDEWKLCRMCNGNGCDACSKRGYSTKG